MAGEDDEVIVNLSGDTSTTDVKVVTEGDGKTAAPAGTQVSFNEDDGTDPIVDLKKQFGQITGRLQNVVEQQGQQLHDATQRLQRAEAQVAVSQIDTIESGISQVEQDIQNAERAYAAAMEAGDGMAMARATRAMQRGEIQLSELSQARDTMKRDVTRRPQEPQRRAVPSDPVEAVIATGNVSPKSAAWLRSHPECITDKKLNARMLAAHNLALADDIQVDSDEYFERIEQGIKSPSARKEAQPQPKPANGDGRRPSSSAAGGGAAGGNLNGGAVEVRLTKGEAQTATDGTLVWNYDDPSGKNLFKKGDPIGLAEMARRKLEGQKRGLYDRNNIEA